MEMNSEVEGGSLPDSIPDLGTSLLLGMSENATGTLEYQRTR